MLFGCGWVGLWTWPTVFLLDENLESPISIGVLDCTPTRLVLGGTPAGTTGTKFLKAVGADGSFTTDDQPLTALQQPARSVSRRAW